MFVVEDYSVCEVKSGSHKQHEPTTGPCATYSPLSTSI